MSQVQCDDCGVYGDNDHDTMLFDGFDDGDESWLCNDCFDLKYEFGEWGL